MGGEKSSHICRFNFTKTTGTLIPKFMTIGKGKWHSIRETASHVKTHTHTHTDKTPTPQVKKRIHFAQSLIKNVIHKEISHLELHVLNMNSQMTLSSILDTLYSLAHNKFSCLQFQPVSCLLDSFGQYR